MNKNGIYLILGVILSLFVLLFLLDVSEIPQPVSTPPITNSPYAKLINDQSPLFLQEKDIFQIKLDQTGIGKRMFTEILGVGVNSPKLDKYRFSLKIEDTLPGKGKIINPKTPTIKMKTLYKEEYEIPWEIVGNENSKKILFTLKDVPAIDASELGKCCEATSGSACNNACGQACSIQFEYQSKFDINPDKYAQVRFDISPKTLHINKKTNITVKITIKNRKLAHYKIAYYVPFKVYNNSIKVVRFPKGFTHKDKVSHMFAEGLFAKIDNKTISLELEITPKKRGELKIPVLFMLSGEMDNLLSEPARVITSRKVVRSLAISKFIWIADAVLKVV